MHGGLSICYATHFSVFPYDYVEDFFPGTDSRTASSCNLVVLPSLESSQGAPFLHPVGISPVSHIIPNQII